MPARVAVVALAASLLGLGAASSIATRYGIATKQWRWKWPKMPAVHQASYPDGYNVRYQMPEGEPTASSKPKVIFVHGFGGNCEHWRKVMPLAESFADCYAIDLLGYGFSDKPTPRLGEPYVAAQFYNFETWGEQLLDFMDEVVQDDAFLITNSVGGVAAMCAAIRQGKEERKHRVRGIQLMSVSLRLLHVENQPALQRPFTKALQWTLRETSLGGVFFGQVATFQGVQSVLQQCYGDEAQVTDELVEAILKPGLEPGALSVFLDFISYSSGPLPGRQLESLQGAGVPVSVLWGDKDPWEPIALGRELLGPTAHPAVVEEFVTLPGLGHCPQDEGPEMVVPRIEEFVKRHA